MAIQLQEHKIVGRYGNLSFYKSEGAYYVRRAGGPSREQIKRSPAFARVREHNTEFGHCCKAGKLLRGALQAYLPKAEGYLYRRVTQLMYQIKNTDRESVRGERLVGKGLKSAEGKKLFLNFKFCKAGAPQGRLDKKMTVGPGGQISLNLSDWKKDLGAGSDVLLAELEVLCVRVDFEKAHAETVVLESFVLKVTERGRVLRTSVATEHTQQRSGTHLYFLSWRFFDSEAAFASSICCEEGLRTLAVDLKMNRDLSPPLIGVGLDFRVSREIKKMVTCVFYDEGVLVPAPA